jgi:tetratricopeptide (TPR) repeat protein
MSWKKVMGLAALAAVISCALIASAREPKKAVSKNAEAQKAIDAAWKAVDDEINLKNVDAAVKELEKARKLDPNNVDLLNELADQYYYHGELMPRKTDADYDARNVWFEKGYEAASASLKIKETAGGHYWAAANLAAENENSTIVGQVYIFPELKEHMDWIDKNDPNYKYRASARFWSRVVVRVPEAVIKRVGQDPEQVYQWMEQAIKAEPRFLDNYVYKAEFLWARGKKAEALATLDTCLKMDPNAFPEERAYNKYAQSRARGLWKEWTGKEYPNK